MKKLTALLAFLGSMSVTSVAYGEEMRTINIRDVPVPRPEQFMAESHYFDNGMEYTEKVYDTNNDGRLDLRFIYLVAKKAGGVRVLIGPLEMTTFRNGINHSEEVESLKIIFDAPEKPDKKETPKEVYDSKKSA